MKTLSLAMGTLLLLTVYYSAAMPHAVNEIGPVSCCFKFFTGRIPQQEIISVVKTHSSCQEKGFVVKTARGKAVCVSHNLNWVQKAFQEQQGSHFK
uniref:C-C motif chemokine 4-like n=1 Tax=Scatophagus argus TaxID=75038 RepID=UPI001ED7F452|nr:C-C motif chemokine 4-like [Scatophagus argus]